MALTANSTLGEIMKQPNAAALFEKHSGQKVDMNQLQQGMGYPLSMIAGYIGWDQAKVDAFIKELNGG